MKTNATSLSPLSFSFTAVSCLALMMSHNQAAPTTLPEGVVKIMEDGRSKLFRIATDRLRRQDPKTGRSEIIPAKGIATLDRLAASARQLAAASGNPHDIVLEDPDVPGATRMISHLIQVETAEPATDESLQTLGAGAAVIRPDGFPRTHAVLRFNSSAEALAALPNLRAAGAVKLAEPLLGRAPELQYVPNDPLFAYNSGNSGYQWHLRNTGQNSGTAGVDCNVSTAWEAWRGSGIRVAVVDSGLETTHPDLALNCDTTADHDFLDDTPDDPMGLNSHGTSTAGIIAARGNNGIGTTGIAMNATLIGLRLIEHGIDITDLDITNALNYSNIDISSNSWGYIPGGGFNTIPVLRGFGGLPVLGMEIAATAGRNGRGVIFVFSSGNYAEFHDDANYQRHQTILPVISVAAVNDVGEKSVYSNPGACVLISAPSNDTGHQGITTTTFTENGTYFNGFGGTSAACPVVSGVVALMLQSKPTLGWRDVQEILIRSARKNHAADTDWATNGAGFHFNHAYGAGLVDAQAAITLASTWTNLGVQQQREVVQNNLNLAIPDNNASGLTRSFTFSTGSNIRVEQVQVATEITHPQRGDLEIYLTSPSGIVSKLKGSTNDYFEDVNWTFKSVRHWGENSQGTWTLRIADRRSTQTGSLKSATIRLWGTSPTPATAPNFTTGYALIQGNQNSPLFYQFSAANNPTSFSINQPVPGLTLEMTSGAWSGTPTQSGVFTRTVTATNSAGSDSIGLMLTVLPPKPAITGDTFMVMVGSAISQQIQISESPTSVTATGLPFPLACSNTGLITGTPNTVGTYVASISATNANGTGTGNIILKVAPSSTALTDALDTRGRIWLTELATPWTTWSGSIFAWDGVDCARSAPIMEFVDRTPIETIVEGPAAFRFYYRHSGHPTNLVATRVNIDTTEIDYLHNTDTWVYSDSYNIPAGTHRVWLDASIGQLVPSNKGESYMWLDQVKFGTPESFMSDATEYTGPWLLSGDGLFRLRNYSVANDTDIDEARTEDMHDGGVATAMIAIAGPGTLTFR